MQPVYTSDGRAVGQIQDNIYHTNRRRSVHQLRQPPAWAIDREILRQLAEAGVTYVHLRDTESDTLYTATVSDFWRHGIRVNRGFGEQIALPLAYWRVDGRRSLAEQQTEHEAAKQSQMSLFEVDG